MKNKFLISGSIIAAVLTSLCCIGPLLLAGFGIGSVAFFSRFDAFRPYLILASVLLLAPAFYFAYRKREVKCEDGSCKIESAVKWNKISVWFAVLIVAGFIAFPYLGFTKSGQNQLNENPKFQTVELKINNMDCEACALALQSQLKNINGVKDANVDFSKANAKINYDPVQVSASKFVKVLTESGYSAKIEIHRN
jgi:copper chaperone CopZ